MPFFSGGYQDISDRSPSREYSASSQNDNFGGFGEDGRTDRLNSNYVIYFSEVGQLNNHPVIILWAKKSLSAKKFVLLAIKRK